MAIAIQNEEIRSLTKFDVLMVEGPRRKIEDPSVLEWLRLFLVFAAASCGRRLSANQIKFFHVV
jgi:hypothetical protein